VTIKHSKDVASALAARQAPGAFAHVFPMRRVRDLAACVAVAMQSCWSPLSVTNRHSRLQTLAASTGLFGLARKFCEFK